MTLRPFVRLALVAASCTALPCAAARASDYDYAVQIGGRPLDNTGTSARTHRGVLYVNVARFARALDGSITTDPATHAETLTIGAHTATFVVGSNDATVDGTKERLPGTPFIAGGDSFVPIDTMAHIDTATFTVDRRKRMISFVPPVAPLVAPGQAAIASPAPGPALTAAPPPTVAPAAVPAPSPTVKAADAKASAPKPSAPASTASPAVPSATKGPVPSPTPAAQPT